MKLLLLNSAEHDGEIRGVVRAADWRRSDYDSVIQSIERRVRTLPPNALEATALRQHLEGLPITVYVPEPARRAALADALAFMPRQFTAAQEREAVAQLGVIYRGVRFRFHGAENCGCADCLEERHA